MRSLQALQREARVRGALSERQVGLAVVEAPQQVSVGERVSS